LLVAVIDRLAAGLESRYRIERELGAGGMALVFLARDVRHDRPVALKLLRPELSAILGGERFLAEIRTTANLQHPHILPLHDSGEVDGLVYYVMPFVEGESLRDRLNRERQLPVEDAVRIAREVASALDYAHRRGVVHRDIKPENILLHDGQALVADFGIALAASKTNGATRLTETGMSLGTPQYMAPEQAMGDRDISARADIFALGCVLYEMLVGEPPFAGPSAQAVVARMLTEPPRGLTVQRQTIPSHVEAAALKALQKLPADRFASAAQFAEALGNTTFSAPAVATTSRRVMAARLPWLPMVVTGILAVVATSAVWLGMAPDPAPRPVARFRVLFPSGQSLATVTRHALAISPDGSEIAFSTPSQLLRRKVSELDLESIQGSVSQRVGVSNPAYSPDGTAIAYWSAGAIRRITLSGGAVITVCEAPNPFGIHWDESGIVFAGIEDILRVSPDGGTPEVIVDLPTGESAIGPQMLSGDRVLFTWAEGLGADRWERAKIVVQNIKTGERTVLIDGGSDGRYLPSGHIVYALGGNLLAVPFDIRAMKVTGGPVPVIEGIRRGVIAASGVAHYAFSRSGTMAFVPGPPGGGSAGVDLALTDRSGATQRLGLPPAPYEYPRVSPDGKLLAVGTEDGKEANIWIYPLDGSSAIRRLTLTGKDRFPIWSGDGVWVAFQSMRDGDAGIFRQRADGSGTVERLTTADAGTTHTPESWSPTQNVFLFSKTRNDTSTLWLQSLSSGSSAPFGDVRSIGNRIGATFSPDGKWVAYSTSETSVTAENYVYVQPFPATGARYQISQSGENGHHPMWSPDRKESPDQKELLYVPLVGQLAARSVTVRPTFAFGNPVQIPRMFPVAAPTTPRTFDITPDRRVIGVIAGNVSLDGRGGGGGASAATPEVIVVLNWFDELKARVKSP
jgi:eukaryotic-like serine/threonine-protein kinase